jgi:hypothetical protein
MNASFSVLLLFGLICILYINQCSSQDPKLLDNALIIKGANNKTCLIAIFAINIQVPSEGTNQSINVPPNAVLDQSESRCSIKDEEAILKINWGEGQFIRFTFRLDKDDTKDDILLHDIKLHLTISGHDISFDIHELDESRVKRKHGYSCMSERKFSLRDSRHQITMVMEQAQWEVFREKDVEDDKRGNEFIQTHMKCPEDTAKPKWVPIAFGSILGVVVVAVIAGLVITRLKSRQ